MKDSIAKELQHLSSEKIEELYARYLAGEKNKDLTKEFGIDVHENKLLSLFPPVIHQDKQTMPLLQYSNAVTKARQKILQRSHAGVPSVHALYGINKRTI